MAGCVVDRRPTRASDPTSHRDPGLVAGRCLGLLHGKDVRPVEISRICFEHRTCGKLTTRRSPVSFGAGTLELHLDRQADPAGAAR